VRRCNFSLVNDKYPFAIANVDRIVVGEDAGLEIKTTSELNMMRFRNGDYPGNYYCQCVHYLAVTGKARWYLAVLIGNREFKTFVIERDEDEIKALMEAERYFWDNYVKTMTQPPADGHRATTETVGKMYPDDNGDDVDLTDIAEDFAQRKRLKESRNAIDAQIDEIDNRIKLRMGEASKGTAGLFSASWKVQTRNSFDAEALKADYPEIDLSKYTRSTQSRVFRVTEQKPKKQ
jgi:predicted phage-related endonuclease